MPGIGRKRSFSSEIYLFQRLCALRYVVCAGCFVECQRASSCFRLAVKQLANGL